MIVPMYNKTDELSDTDAMDAFDAFELNLLLLIALICLLFGSLVTVFLVFFWSVLLHHDS